MATGKRKFKKGLKVETKTVPTTVVAKKKVVEEKLFDKNYWTGIGRLVSKVKGQVNRIKIND